MRKSDSDVWSADASALWERLAAHAFEQPAMPLDFCRRLAREQGWTLAYARRAIEEYRRYCFLACVAGREMTPSLEVDEVWHLHLTYTRDYWQLWCPQVLRATLHHGPTLGGPQEALRHAQQYADTLAVYEHWFGAPPADLWPGTRERFAAGRRMRRVDLGRHFVLPRPRWPRRISGSPGLLALAASLVTGDALALGSNPLDWTGGPFLQLYLLLMLVAVIGSIVLRRSLRDTGAGSGGTPDVFELAYLADGPARCTDAAVTRLLHDGDAVWDVATSTLRLKGRVSDLQAPLDSIAKCIAVDGKPAALVKRAEAALAPLRQRLEQRGLWLNAAQVARVRWLGCLPLFALLAFGFAKMQIGLSRGKPIALLVVLSIVLGVITLVFLLKRPRRTRAGDRALATAKVRHARATRAPRPEDLSLAVALAGTTILGTTAYAQYHQNRQPPASSSDSSGSDGSSSDSGGGGDGGGGGCGGCGGGGD